MQTPSFSRGFLASCCSMCELATHVWWPPWKVTSKKELGGLKGNVNTYVENVQCTAKLLWAGFSELTRG